MLSARAYSFRQKSRLAISLSWVAGYVNVITFVVCGQVISHTTGNVTHFGNALGDGEWPRVGYFGFLLAAFFAGAVSSAFMTEGARRQGSPSKYMLPLAVEAILLAALGYLIGAYGYDATRPVPAAGFGTALYLMTGVASFAMGLQNATITKISGAVVRTTHLTGVVTDLGLEGVQYLLWVRDKTRGHRDLRRGRVLRVSRRHPSLLRVALLGSIVGSFLTGVTAGTIAFTRLPRLALLVPVAFLVFIVWVDWRKPIADVVELDLLADPEWGGYESVKAMLPPGLGIYRLTHHRKGARHEPPDFQAWVDRLPRHWRVVILAVSPLTHFDTDAALDLLAAVQKLRAARRDLIVCGLHPPQYRVLRKGGVTDVLGMENVCADLDFAIARGMNIVDEMAAGRAGHYVASGG